MKKVKSQALLLSNIEIIGKILHKNIRIIKTGLKTLKPKSVDSKMPNIENCCGKSKNLKV